MFKTQRAIHLWLLAAILSSLGLKIWLQIKGVLPFNSDEAIVALMASHILKGGEHPIFFYGQAYMGSLDAYLVALGFFFLGSKVWVIRFIQSMLYIGTIISTYKIGSLIFNSSKKGLLAAVFISIPTVNVMLYSTVSIGGYGEAILLGNIILLTTILWLKEIEKTNFEHPPHWGIFAIEFYYRTLFGFLCGFSLWVNGLTLVYSIPSGLVILYSYWNVRKQINRKKIAQNLIGLLFSFLVGSLPWWIYAEKFGLHLLISELLGGAVAVEQGGWLVKIFNHTLYFLLFGITAILGLRPPWDIKWLGLPLIPFVLVFWGWALYTVVKKIRQKTKTRIYYFLLAGVMVTVTSGYIFTSFGVDPSGRYFLPFAVPLALLASDIIISAQFRQKIYGTGICLLLVVYNLCGIIQCANPTFPGLTTQFDQTTIINHAYDNQLIQFLRDHGETRGYTNYWVAYPLAFLSNEELIFVPALPYHQDLRYTNRDDRYKAYDALVEASPKVAYITAHNPALDKMLTQEFQAVDVEWNEIFIGDYHVFYNLSRPVRAGELSMAKP